MGSPNELALCACALAAADQRAPAIEGLFAETNDGLGAGCKHQLGLGLQPAAHVADLAVSRIARARLLTPTDWRRKRWAAGSALGRTNLPGGACSPSMRFIGATCRGVVAFAAMSPDL